MTATGSISAHRGSSRAIRSASRSRIWAGNLVYANTNDGQQVLFNLLMRNPPGEISSGYLVLTYTLTVVTREVITGLVDFEAILKTKEGGAALPGHLQLPPASGAVSGGAPPPGDARFRCSGVKRPG